MAVSTSTLQQSISAYNMNQACSPILTDLHDLYALQAKLANAANGMEDIIKIADQTEDIATKKIEKLSTFQELVKQLTTRSSSKNLCIRASPAGTFFITTKSLRAKLGLSQHAAGISRAAKHQLKSLGVNCKDISQLDNRVERTKKQLRDSTLTLNDRNVIDHAQQIINSGLNDVSKVEAVIKELVRTTKAETALILFKANAVKSGYSDEYPTDVEAKELKCLQQRLETSPPHNMTSSTPDNRKRRQAANQPAVIAHDMNYVLKHTG